MKMTDLDTKNVQVTRTEKCIWFSRHSMTEAQAAEIAAAGYEVMEDCKLRDYAAMNITSSSDVMDVIIHMQVLRDRDGVRRFYGVFPPVIRAALLTWRKEFGGNKIELWESWNVQRPPDGGKPTFEHKKFVLTYKG